MSDNKDVKQRIVEWYLSAFRQLNISDKSIGYIIRSCHAVMPMVTTFIIIFGSQIYALLTIGLLICAFISFWIFNGCILSSIEYKLDNIDITIMDPLIEILKLDVTPHNRMRISKIASCLYMVTVIILYFVRFGTLRLHNNIYSDLNLFQNFYQRGPKEAPKKGSE